MPVKRLGSTLRRHGTVGEILPDPLPFSGPVAEKIAVVAFDTDEWDPQRGAFWQHAVAGSAAGLAEHSVMFPVDTVKTHMQVNSATRTSLLEMVQAQGIPRMWRGVQTMFTGCIPAHALYFSIFKALKPRLTQAAMGLYSPASLSGVSSRADSEGAFLSVGPSDSAPSDSGRTSDAEMAAALGAGAAVTLATVAQPA